MSKLWCRKQNFFQSPPNEIVVSRKVQFYCRRYDKIKAVEVLWMFEKLRVSIFPTHKGDQLLKTKISKIPNNDKIRFGKSAYFSDLFEYDLYLYSENSLALVAELLTVLGDAKDIITEINNIYHFIYSYNSQILYKHIIESQEHNHQNFNYTKSMSLVSLFVDRRLFSDHHCVKETKEMDDLLMSGANANMEMGSETILGFCVRVLTDVEQTIIKLLIYGADPFKYTEYNMRCPYSVALEQGNCNILRLFDQVGYRRSKGMGMLRIQDDIYRDRDAIITRFAFSDKRVYQTSLKRNVDLTVEEKKDFIEMYKSNFPKQNNDKASEQAAIDDIDSENTMVEAITCNNLLVGMNIFRILFKTNNVASFEVSLCVLKPEHRNNPLVLLLAYRIPCALQLILPDHDIYVMLLMVNYVSFDKLYKDVLNTSKYISQPMNAVLCDSLDVSLNSKYDATRSGMTYYVADQVEVSKPYKPSSEQTIYERFFNEVLLGLPSGSASTRGRAHPGLFFIGDQFVSLLSQLNLEFGINFYRHIIELARCIEGRSVSFGSLVALNKNTHTMFYTGKREVGTLNLPLARL